MSNTGWPNSRYPTGGPSGCWICKDPRDHDGIPHGVATGDDKTRVEAVLDRAQARLDRDTWAAQHLVLLHDAPDMIATLRAVMKQAKEWSADWTTTYDSGVMNRCGDDLQRILYDGLIRSREDGHTIVIEEAKP